jgi:hypothetical protein
VAVQTIEVEVLPVNEPPRLALPPEVTIPTVVAAGQVIATAAAADADAGDTLRFSLVDDAQGRYAIDPEIGSIRAAAADDGREIVQELRVRVTDAAGLFEERSIDLVREVAIDVGVVVVSAPNVEVPLLPTLPPPAEELVAPPKAAAESDADESALPGRSAEGDGRQAAGDVVGDVVPDWLQPVDPAMAADDGSRTAPLWAPRARDGGDWIQASIGSALVVSATGSGVEVGRSSIQPLDFSGVFETAAWRDESVQLARLGLRDSGADAEGERDAESESEDTVSTLLDSVLISPESATSATLTVGFVWWLTRSGGLIAGMLVGVPAWRHVDLLPVLASDGDDDDEEEGDEFELATRFDADGVEGMFDRDDRLRADWGSPK